MENGSFRTIDDQVIIRLRDRICDTSDRMLTSALFLRITKQYIAGLSRKQSRLLNIFPNPRAITDDDIHLLVEALRYLIKLPVDLIPRIIPEAEVFFANKELFFDFMEKFYNYWRNLHRLIICDSAGNSFDQRPYRTFNGTLETLMHVVRSTYRDIQENVSGKHPRIYRQVAAGAQVGTIALPKNIAYPDAYKKLNSISVIRQVLIYPPMIFDSTNNKRKGVFERVYQNPVGNLDINKNDWLCYPAKVGPLLIMTYFNVKLFELGFALSNLFEVANDEDLERTPDAIYMFGTPDSMMPISDSSDTVFFDDEENGILTSTIPMRDEFGYFGYLKKMILTLHNIKIMKMGRLPFHGAMFNITVRDKGSYTVMIIGDSGAGKSESLEALRTIAGDDIEDITIIADDMGSIDIDPESGKILGYGTETGAFVRMDDLQPGYAFGQIDRAIIMNASQVNARVVLPVTTYDEVMRGYPVDFVLYANNYEVVDKEHPTIERFDKPETALGVFEEGRVMSKGTTATSGVVQNYFANIFGPPQYKEEHQELAIKYFKHFFDQGLYVGQFRTQLGITGKEHSGPEDAARHLLSLLKNI